MFGDIGWAELLIIGVVALIVIGPEDLPEMFRQLGRFTAKIKSMSREFQRAMDQAARESGVNDVAKDLKAATSAKSLGLSAVKEAADKFEKWDPLKPAAARARPPVPETAPVEAQVDAPPEGPATAALRQKQAARRAVLQESTAKLKAIEAGETGATGGAPSAAAKPKRAVRAKVAAEPLPVTEAGSPKKTATRRKKAPEA